MSEVTRMITLATVARRVNRTPQTLLRWAEVREFPRPVLLTADNICSKTSSCAVGPSSRIDRH
jgi:hypothetical protein